MNFMKGDATRLPFRDQSVDLVFGSPPYQSQRAYGIGFRKDCLQWVEWMLDVTTEAVRVSRGLVLWVVAGCTRKHVYQPGPEMLLAEWWKRGGHCWRPCYWHRVGIPGSGGKQWLRADVEYVLAFKRPGLLPFADNTANGHPPKWAPGGEMSYRVTDGARVNQWGHSIESGATVTNGDFVRSCGRRPSHTKQATARRKNGTRKDEQYAPPALANPGTLVKVIVGGGVMGHPLSHLNEAPFPQALAEWFIRGWSIPGGTVLDPFSGSGTTVCAAEKLGRRGIGLDIRDNQVLLGMKRLSSGVDRELFVS